ncbi:unnamed protein product [Candidatus Paraburkholderia kirkii UZHbot1]|uniref:WGS project CAFE00000000 data, contig bkir_c144 n=1 Tax=Candidatus Paraburkholderia kirkii UZHbot1 TaxID=1055526 RepID=U3UAH8_9BURK|nr:unnamed protein product [Candidatus Paraburkholderia kirkii UZHbot1]
MVGIALAEGRIASLDDPIVKYLLELKEGAYGGVTIRQIFEMRSGVDYEKRYDFQHPGVAANNHIAALVRNTTDSLMWHERLGKPMLQAPTSLIRRSIPPFWAG